MSSISRVGTNLWTDAYLAAFALISGFTFVTFDRGIERSKNTAVLNSRPAILSRKNRGSPAMLL
jgi:predicted nucleic acid-binding protein